MQDVFHGKDIDPEKASFFQEYYGETPDKLIGNLGFMAQMIGYCGGIFGRIHQGIGAEIANLKKTAEQKQTNLSFGYAILENDSIIKPTDLQNLETPDLINLLGTVETYAHSSIAYHPEEIIPAINEKL